MTTIQDYLKEVRSRLEAATPGPWHSIHHLDDTRTGQGAALKRIYCTSKETNLIARTYNLRDDKLIAHCPTDLERLTNMLEVALEALDSIASEHKPKHETEEYWLARKHESCATVLATDTKIARKAKKQIEAMLKEKE